MSTGCSLADKYATQQQQQQQTTARNSAVSSPSRRASASASPRRSNQAMAMGKPGGHRDTIAAAMASSPASTPTAPSSLSPDHPYSSPPPDRNSPPLTGPGPAGVGWTDERLPRHHHREGPTSSPSQLQHQQHSNHRNSSSSSSSNSINNNTDSGREVTRVSLGKGREHEPKTSHSRRTVTAAVDSSSSSNGDDSNCVAF